MPLASVAARAAQLRPASHRGESRAAGERRHDRRRQLQREPDGDQEARSTCWRPTPRVAAHRGHRRDARARRSLGRAARGRRTRGGERPASTCCSPSAARRRRRWPTRRSPSGMPAANVRYFATSDEAADAAVALVKHRRSRAGEGIARRENGSRGGSAQGGARLMLYHLLYPFHTQLSVLNVTRYITFRTAAATLSALAISLAFGPWLIRKLREFQIGQVIRTEGPQSHRPKAGTPTMGGLLILTAALVPTLLWADLTNVLRLDRGADDGRLRRDRLRRRLPEDRAPLAPRAAAPLQDGVPDPHRRRGRRRAAHPAAPGRSTTRGSSFRSSSA